MRFSPYTPISPSDWHFRDDPYIAPLLAKGASHRSANFERESIRQWALSQLIENLRLPADWIGHRIVPMNADSVFGVAVANPLGPPFLVVSVAKPGQSDLAESNLREFLRHSPSTALGISTDGSHGGTQFIRRNYYADKCEYVRAIETYGDPRNGTSPQPALFDTASECARRGTSRDLRPLTKSVESLFFDIHSHMRDIDGLHADDALDELCKVLFLKLYDERQTKVGSPYKLQRWLYGSADEMASVVRTLDAKAKTTSRDRSGGRSRADVFADPIRLSTSAMTKVIEALQDYTITGTPTDVKGRAFQQVIGPAMRSGMGQYFTPNEIVEFMVEVAAPSATDLVLDPFCGSAHFLIRCLEREGIAAATLHGIEKSDRMARVATIDAELTDEEQINVRCADALLDFSNYVDLRPESFDVILTNPPFGSILGVEALSSLGHFDLAPQKGTVPLEVLGLERCIQFLRPGGRLAIVLPEGLIANSRTKSIRAWIEGHAKLRAIVSLPVSTFSPFGANVKTCILMLRKWRVGEVKDENYDVALVKIDDVGYDASGRLTGATDLGLAAEKLTGFFSKSGW